MLFRSSTIDETMAWIEIGPHPVCINFVKSILPHVNVAVPSIRRGEDNWQTMSHSLGLLHCAGVELNWNEFHQPFEQNLRLVDLPTYAWNDKTHWIQYIGDWALTKGNTYYDAEKAAANPGSLVHTRSSIKTSTVQQIIEETFSDSAGTVVMQSNLMEADFLAAAHGHRMNDCGVVTSVSLLPFLFFCTLCPSLSTLSFVVKTSLTGLAVYSCGHCVYSRRVYLEEAPAKITEFRHEYHQSRGAQRPCRKQEH